MLQEPLYRCGDTSMPPSSTPPRANVSVHASTGQYSTPNSRGGSAISNHTGLLSV
ncbi:hypothetical protein K503DRAFT_777927, partial [Rhizopogon vinicolor AM-OR11-026]